MDPLTIASIGSAALGGLSGLFGGGSSGPRYEPFLLEGSKIVSPFGTTASQLDTENNVLNTYAFLNPALNNARQYAEAGLGETLEGLRWNYGSNFFNRSPQDQVAYLDSASNPVRALLDAQAARSLREAQGRARVQAATTGNQNSTAYGSALAGLEFDKALTDANNRVQAMDFEQNRMLSSLGGATQLLGNYSGTLANLAGLINPSIAATNNNVMNGLASYQGAATSANNLIGQQQTANNALNQSGMGSGIAGALTALGYQNQNKPKVGLSQGGLGSGSKSFANALGGITPSGNYDFMPGLMKNAAMALT